MTTTRPKRDEELSPEMNRRSFLRLGVGVPASLAVLAYGGYKLLSDRPGPDVYARELEQTPACGEGSGLTVAETEGPYFKVSSPERISLLETGITGTRLVVSGYVVSRQCQPIAGALLDFWQADDSGNYDNVGYRMRGHQFTDGDGRFQLETVVPGLYPGRTRHIHVKVQPANGRILTTQLYFPDEPRNSRDGLYNPALQMQVGESAEGQVGTFTFVVEG